MREEGRPWEGGREKRRKEEGGREGGEERTPLDVKVKV